MKRKGGRKHGEGVTKRNILLIALEYLEGVEESELIDRIKVELELNDRKGIKWHLADLGGGRNVRGEDYREGKHYLIKEEQSGKANIWKPDTDFEIYREIASELLKEKDCAVPFMQTKYAQKMIKEHGFPLVERVFNIDLSEDTEVVKVLKNIILKYPGSLLYFLLESDASKIRGLEAIAGDYIKFMWIAPELYQLFLPSFKDLLKNIDDEISLANYFLKTHNSLFHPELSSPSAVDIEKLREITLKSLVYAFTPEILHKLGGDLVNIATLEGYIAPNKKEEFKQKNKGG